MPLQRQGIIEFWYDRKITAGTLWEQEISKHLNSAQIILLLVSSDFISSEYCYSIEMMHAIERHKQGHACVIPIILRPVDWQEAPFSKFQALPTDAKPVISEHWSNQDDAFLNVAKGVRKAAEDWIANPRLFTGGDARNDTDLGSHLRKLRNQAKLSQKRFADLVGVTETALRNWESNTSIPKAENLKKLIEVHLRQGTFPKGKEQQEIKELWELACLMIPHGLKMALDEEWLGNKLIEIQWQLGDGWRMAASSNNVPLHRLRASSFSQAPAMGKLYGREKELVQLKQWLINDDCQIVAVFGIGGIGKTSLAARLAEQTYNAFERHYWCSLQNALPFKDFLRDCVQVISDQTEIDLPKNIEGQISSFIQCLQSRRCLIVLDNFDSILQKATYLGQYREGYEGYQRLLEDVGQAKTNRSCLLLTSRERPSGWTLLDGNTKFVRCLSLAGLSTTEGVKIFEDRGLFGVDSKLVDKLIQIYSGNPLVLKLICEPILEVFGGDVGKFLKEKKIVIGGIGDILNSQFARLSELEEEVMYWLAIEREWVSLDDLREDIVGTNSKKSLPDALLSLLRRSLIERNNAAGFTLQPVILEYATDRFIGLVCKEMYSRSINLFGSHALIKAQARDYVRESQIRLILLPIVESLLKNLGEDLEKFFKRMLTVLRESYHDKHSYAAGNILNLFVQAKWDVQGYDFSHLTVRQAYLQGASLPDVNFTGSEFTTSIFSDTFGNILCIAFSPDGNLMAVGTINAELRLWDAVNNKLLFTFRGHTDWVWSVAFSPDGRTIASGSEDREIRLWDVSSGQCLRVLKGHRSTVSEVTFSPDGRILASASHDCKIMLWDSRTGQCLRTLSDHEDLVWSVIFSPNGSILVSGSEDCTIRLWDPNTGQCLRVLRGDTSWIYTIAISPDGSVLASGGANPTVHLWDMKTGQCLNMLQGHTDWVWSVAFSPDGRTLVSGGEDLTVRLWDVGSGQCLRVLRDHHTKTVSPVVFTPDGRTIVSAGNDRTLRLWDTSTWQCLKTLYGYTNQVRSVAFSPDGRILASGSDDQSVRLWDVNSGQCLRILEGSTDQERNTDQVWSVAFSPDGGMLASSSDKVLLWDIRSGSYLKTLQSPVDWFYSVAFSPDGRILAGSSDDQAVRLWDVHTGQCLRSWKDRSDADWSIAFSSDGTMLASGSKTVRLWNISTGRCLKTLRGHTDRVWSVAFSPNGQILASGSADSTIRIWDVNAGRHLKILHGHSDQVRSVAFSPDGRTLISGGEDKTMRQWDVDSGNCLQTLQGHTDPILCVAFSPSGSIVASASQDGTIKLWDIQTGTYLRTLRSDRPYERMNITDIKGLTVAQKSTLKTLGAIERGTIIHL